MDLAGKHIVVTGANTGIGRAAAAALAARGAAVTLACRSADKTRPVVEALRATSGNPAIELLALDLASLASVRAAAAELVAAGRPIDVLINNAGVGGQRGVTADGFELHFGINHLGHFLLTELLLAPLRAAPAARVIAVSSNSHFQARAIDWEVLRGKTRTYTGLREYAVSKLANVLHMAELGRRLAGDRITTYAVHPGVIASDIWRRAPWILRRPAMALMRTTEEGAISTLRCATAPELAGVTGRYYQADGAERRPSRLAQDPELATELWRRSEAMVAEAS
jgi:retinol dehydrogenase 12